MICRSVIIFSSSHNIEMNKDDSDDAGMAAALDHEARAISRANHVSITVLLSFSMIITQFPSQLNMFKIAIKSLIECFMSVNKPLSEDLPAVRQVRLAALLQIAKEHISINGIHLCSYLHSSTTSCATASEARRLFSAQTRTFGGFSRRLMIESLLL